MEIISTLMDSILNVLTGVIEIANNSILQDWTNQIAIPTESYMEDRIEQEMLK